MEKSSGLSWNI